MKICAIADMHGNLPEIPECDLLLIAGDICPHFCTRYGHVGDIDDVWGQADWLRHEFGAWLDKVPAKEVVAVFGNHDWVAEKRPQLIPKLRWHLLQDSTVSVLGLKIFGSPFQPYFHHWAFNAPPGEEGEEFLAAKWHNIPNDTDIIIVHGPPSGYGDIAPDGRPTGSPSLTERIKVVRPKLSVHGHIHCGRGVWRLTYADNTEGIITNASILNEAYQMVFEPMKFEI
jgi:Icc-related predicted phosphoesterase